MRNLFTTGIAVTFVSGFIFCKCLPIRVYVGSEVEKQIGIEAIFVGITLLYLAYALWKELTQRLWIKVPVIFGILFFALITGYIVVGFVLQPLLLSTSWTFRLLADNESNIVWYWAFGISLTTYLLYAGVRLFDRMIRGETFLF